VLSYEKPLTPDIIIRLHCLQAVVAWDFTRPACTEPAERQARNTTTSFRRTSTGQPASAPVAIQSAASIQGDGTRIDLATK